ncbi:hypothetical protein BDZ89DRAFT_1109389 [Hymenopellis radicata]|nr:hypothetical protein BDZ89DRAFT_1109389 [Hymenopellis radicata]
MSSDITTFNILFRASKRILEWSDADLYAYIGDGGKVVVLIDFEQSYALASPPKDFEPATVITRGTIPSVVQDVWARAEFPLFELFLGSNTHVLRQNSGEVARSLVGVHFKNGDGFRDLYSSQVAVDWKPLAAWS